MPCRTAVISALAFAWGSISADAAQQVPVRFNRDSEVSGPVSSVEISEGFIPPVPEARQVRLSIQVQGLDEARAAVNRSTVHVGSDPVCKTVKDTTDIQGCSFETETTIYCSAEDTWGGVKVTEKASGETITTQTTHCSGDSDCTDKMTQLAEEAMAYLYKYALGSSVSDVKDGVCSCGVQSTKVLGENFAMGICLSFDNYKSLEKEDVSFKAYALGDRDSSHVGYTYDYNCNDEGYGDNVTACAIAVGTAAVNNALNAKGMSGTGGMYSTGDYEYTDPFAGAQDDDNDKVDGDAPYQCPYGTSSTKIGYIAGKGGNKAKLYLCTISGVKSDSLGGFGGMYQDKARRRQLTGSEDESTNKEAEIVGDATYDNPWTGSTSCPDGFVESNVWRVELWDDDNHKGYIVFCNGKGGPAGLIASGYQVSDNDNCNKDNHYTGKQECPDGYKDVKVVKGDCNGDSSEMYICYNEDQL